MSTANNLHSFRHHSWRERRPFLVEMFKLFVAGLSVTLWLFFGEPGPNGTETKHS